MISQYEEEVKTINRTTCKINRWFGSLSNTAKIEDTDRREKITYTICTPTLDNRKRWR